MPKIVGYPRASFNNAIELANAVYDLGGVCSVHTCADKMGKSVSGGFKALVSAADKFELIKNQRGELTNTELFNKYIHAYSEQEEQELLREAFLSSGVFSSLYQRFQGRAVPTDILDRILVREFEVPVQMASRISGYFVKGARFVGLLDSDNKLIEENAAIGAKGTEQDTVGIKDPIYISPEVDNCDDVPTLPVTQSTADTYTIHFSGPGLNSTIEITDDSDLKIVEALLAKVQQKLSENED